MKLNLSLADKYSDSAILFLSTVYPVQDLLSDLLSIVQLTY